MQNTKPSKHILYCASTGTIRAVASSVQLNMRPLCSGPPASQLVVLPRLVECVLCRYSAQQDDGAAEWSRPCGGGGPAGQRGLFSLPPRGSDPAAALLRIRIMVDKKQAKC